MSVIRWQGRAYAELRNAPVYALLGLVTALFALDVIVRQGVPELRRFGLSVALCTIPRVVAHEVRGLWSRAVPR